MTAFPTTRLAPYHQTTHSLAALAGCVAIGVCAAIVPLLAIAVAALIYVALRGQAVIRDMLLVVLIGNMALNYGFANLGLRLGPLPLPLTDAFVVGLTAWILVYRVSLKDLGLSGFFMGAILLFGIVRLVADWPDYGTLALRDFTTPLETLTLVVGFFAYRAFGHRWATRFWLIASLAVLAYSLTFPLRDSVLAMSPTVGLQQPVQLLGHYSGLGAALGAALFFFMLRVKAPWSLLLGAVSLGILLMFQSRGVYIGVPLAAVAAVYASRGLKTSFLSRLAGSLVFGTLVMVVIVPFAPEGRMGPMSLKFVSQQVGTLFGQSGPGDGSYEDRVEWLHTVREAQADNPLSLVWGLGLGPDLTGGAAGGQEFIRKPHNDYVEIFARFGFLGLALWAGLLGSLVWCVWKGIKDPARSEDERSFLVWIFASIVLYLFLSGTQPHLAYSYGTMPIFMLLGMGLALTRQMGGGNEQEPTQEDARRPVFSNAINAPAAH